MLNICTEKIIRQFQIDTAPEAEALKVIDEIDKFDSEVIRNTFFTVSKVF